MSVKVIDNTNCPWLELGQIGGVINFREDGDVYCSFGTDPNYRVVLPRSAVEIA